MDLKVAILLVLYNDREHIERIVKSIKNQSYKAIDVYAIETSSKGELIDLLQELLPESFIFPYQGNLGFAAGNNYLAQKAISNGADFLFVLNPDMELAVNTIKVFVDYFSQEPNLGVIGSTLLIGDTNRIQLFGVKTSFKTQKKTFLFSNENIESIVLPDEMQVDFVNGGSTFLTKRVYTKVGLFNADYFMYNDEIDFARRVYKAGFKTLVTSKTIIKHHHNWSSTNKESFYMMYYYMMRNKYLYFKENGLGLYLVLDLLMLFIKIPITLKWAANTVDLRLVKFFYLGVFHGLIGRKQLSKVDFSK